MYAHFQNAQFLAFFGGIIADRTEGDDTFVSLTEKQLAQVAAAERADREPSATLNPDGTISIH